MLQSVLTVETKDIYPKSKGKGQGNSCGHG